jgi:UDP-N-acetylmuramate--alanine ligase
MNHLHFMGIAGIGMSGLARWAYADGLQVSGCDLSTGAAVDSLQACGIPVSIGHDPSHLDIIINNQPVDTLVCSMAVPRQHPEVVAARERGITVRYRIDLLAEFLARRRAIAITGTHGKSTTTGMVSHVFLGCDADPSVLVGGHLPWLVKSAAHAPHSATTASNVHYGSGEAFVAEVDESDPGFANVASELAIITNLEDDHIAGDFDERRNYHASLADLENAMLTFAGRAKQVLYCADWEALKPLAAQGISYGLHDTATYQATNMSLTGSGSTFNLCYPTVRGAHDEPVTWQTLEVSLAVPGVYNVQNAVAALAAAHIFGLDVTQAAQALATFTGVGRRWQRTGSVNNALIIDDYAHHPTEVGVTLEAARRTGRRVRAILQPHRWVRTARHWPALADAAGLADEVIVLDIYAAGEKAIPGVSPNMIVERLQDAGKQASYHDFASAEAYLSDSLESNDLIITLGAGDVWKVGQNLLQACGGDDGSA